MATELKIKIGSEWKTVEEAKIKIGSEWKSLSEMKMDINNVWKTIPLDQNASPVILWGSNYLVTDTTYQYARYTEINCSGWASNTVIRLILEVEITCPYDYETIKLYERRGGVNWTWLATADKGQNGDKLTIPIDNITYEDTLSNIDFKVEFNFDDTGHTMEADTSMSNIAWIEGTGNSPTLSSTTWIVTHTS